MLYELRHYDAHSNRDLNRLIQRFADHTLGIWSRFGIEPVGFWSVLIGPHSPRLTYLLAWEDLAQRQERWDAFESDPEWQQVKRESNAPPQGNPVRAITNTILKPTTFSRTPRIHDQPARLAGGIFELRTYSFDDGEQLAQAIEWFGTSGLPHFEKHAMFAMGFWTTSIGVSPRLTYMLVFENLAHRERAWAAFYTDPAWETLSEGLYPNGRRLLSHIESSVMKGTEFSGWK